MIGRESSRHDLKQWFPPPLLARIWEVVRLPLSLAYPMSRYLIALAVLLVCHVTVVAAIGEDRILPASIELSSPKNFQRFLVEFDSVADPSSIEVISTNPDVVKIVDGVAHPVANGEAKIVATAGDRRLEATVTVTGQEEPHAWLYRNHVVSILSKSGCNGGACHGAQAGKSGFKLTLFGYDLDADYDAITRHARGRRVNFSDPGRSLLLTKPTGALPHKGGVRLEVGERNYQVLAEWIAAGAPRHSDADPLLTHFEVLPKQSIRKTGDTQQLIVIAHFNDGHSEDVTSWAKYQSTNESVAKVDREGRVTVMGNGESAINVWYLNRNELAFISSPFESPDSLDDLFAEAPRRNFIDDEVLAKLKSLNLPPSPRCDDSTFIRRAYLDTIGMLPTAEETKAFLADESDDKRDRLIDDLLARPEFVDYWSYKWSDLLLVSGDRLRPKAVETYYGWIRSHVEQNTPWDEMVRELVTATGSTHENGAANFYALHQDPTKMSETVAQAFLGLSINCAKCHNHPLEKWTNDQYYGMANLFARVRGKGWGGDFRNGDGNRIVYSDTQGELIQPATGIAQPPTPLDGTSLAFDSREDRRKHLAIWLTSNENPYFTKAIVNRVWANFFGVGLVEKVDDLRATNPPSNAPLFEATAGYLIENDYDLKVLMRVILQSETYQRSFATRGANAADERFYSHYYPRRMSAEVMLDALSQVTGAASKFKDKPDGTRALQLADASVDSYFLDTFGRPDRLITCECERADEPSMTQVLHLYNGNTLNEKLAAKGNVIEKHLEAKDSDEEIIDAAYLAAFSRSPTDAERKKLLAAFADAPESERRLVIEDLYWSLLTSPEFLFGH